MSRVHASLLEGCVSAEMRITVPRVLRHTSLGGGGGGYVPGRLVVVRARLHATDGAVDIMLTTLRRHRAVHVDNRNVVLGHDALGANIEVLHNVVARVKVLRFVCSAARTW
jgi:hypothetical protein